MRPHASTASAARTALFGLVAGLLLLTAAPLRAQDSSSTQEVKPTTRPLLWVIEGREAPIFLYGTMHVPEDRVLALPEVVKEALGRSDAFYAELKLDRASRMGTTRYLLLPGQQTLHDVVPADLLARAEGYLRKKLGQGLGPMAKFKPWALTQFLTQLDYMPAMQMGKQALDAHLYSKAQQAGKEVGGLEKVEEQMNVFDSLSEEEQVEQLKGTLDKLEEAEKEGESIHEPLIRAYLSGDEQKLVEQAEKEMGEEESAMSEKFMKLLLTDRNVRMVDRIYEKLEQNPGRSYFFAVGALHWPGEEGMLKLLEQKGYSIRRVKVEDAGSFGK